MADELPREIPDRMIRRSLENPANLRDFLRFAVPQLADGFDFAGLEPLGREFFSDDWRLREADLLFEIPYRAEGVTTPALVCLMLEHQSDSDPLVPLRTLVTVAGYWEKCWRQWAELKRPRPEFRLPPVLPIVLYTADRPWGSNKSIRDLLGEPAAFHPHAPTWTPIFWNLADVSPESLLAGGAWMQFLAIMRVSDVDAEAFVPIFREAMRHLSPMEEHVRWSELLRMVIQYSLWRRSAEERDELVRIAAEEHPSQREEVGAMAQTAAEELMARGELEALKGALLAVLRSRFEELPSELVEQINVANDPARLTSAVVRASQIAQPTDLQV